MFFLKLNFDGETFKIWALLWTVMQGKTEVKTLAPSRQRTGNRSSGQSKSKVAPPGTGRSGDWTTWRATARRQRAKTSSCSATGHARKYFTLFSLVPFLHLILLPQSSSSCSSEDEDFGASGADDDEDDDDADAGSEMGSWDRGARPKKMLRGVVKRKPRMPQRRGRKRQRRCSTEEEGEESEEEMG